MLQPMLVSLQKKSHLPPGQDSLIYLVPELCCMTGLSEQMRKNFSLMRDLASCTRLVPSQRMERLQHFNRCLKTNSMVSYYDVSHWIVEIFCSDSKMFVITFRLLFIKTSGIQGVPQIISLMIPSIMIMAEKITFNQNKFCNEEWCLLGC
jgi:hypothetical protein